MAPVLGTRMPTIDTLNERWARLKYDFTKTKLNDLAMKEFDEFYS